MTKPAKKTAKRDTQSGNLIAVNDGTAENSRFVSLVGRPANQRGFQIVRSAAPVVVPQPAAKTVPMKHVRRLASSPVLLLTFPPSFEEGDVAKTLEVYGMSDYKVGKEGDFFTAMRSDLQSISNETPTSIIRLSKEGITATIEGEKIGQPGESQIGVAVVAYEFDSKLFDNESAGAWMIEKKVDFSGSVVENPDKSLLSIEVSPVEEDTEVRRLEVEPGVTFVIMRDEDGDGDVPDGYATAVNEAAYGSWGWGQLDFNANLADSTVSDALSDAIYILSDTLRNILFYSQVPTVDARKQLVENCTAQFAVFANSLLDSLPRQVISLVGRTAQITEKELSMTKAADTTTTETTTTETKPVETKEVATTVETKPVTTAATETTVDDEKAPVTRAEFNALIAKLDALAPKPTETEVAAQRAAAEGKMPLTRADIESVTKGITASVTEAITTKLGETIVRGANTDQATQTVETKNKDAKAPVFRGAIPGLRRPAAATTK